MRGEDKGRWNVANWSEGKRINGVGKERKEESDEGRGRGERARGGEMEYEVRMTEGKRGKDGRF